MRDRREGAWGFVYGRRGVRSGRRVGHWDRRRAGGTNKTTIERR